MVEVSTSLLSVKKEDIIKTIYSLETAKTDYFHIDVMDGEFVKNDTHDLMLEYCEYLNNITNVPLDIHLMVKDLKNFIDSYAIFNPSIITFHYEACKDNSEVLDIINYIKEKNIKVGLSIKPDTPVENIYEFLPYIHMLLVMTVEPGEGGQKLIESTIIKINDVKKYIEKNNIDIYIEADGGININNCDKLKECGTDILVSGVGIINTENYNETINILKNKNS